MKISSKITAVLALSALVIIGCKDKAPAGGEQKMPEGHPNLNMQSHPKVDTQSKITIAPGSIKKAAGGYTVADIYARKASLNGKKVKIRGKVVKYNGNIMSRNWLHIQDGTGKPGSNDLTITTINKAEVGKVVLVEGKLSADKDFGANYKYSVIVEGATVTVEK